MEVNNYTKDTLLYCSNWYQKQLERDDLYKDERDFYSQCLLETLKYLDIMHKNGLKSINIT